jgi:hypothetical protein
MKKLGHLALKSGATLLLISGVSLAVGVDAALAATPPSVTTGTVTAIKPSSVVVSGSVNPNGDATTWYFQFGPSTDTGYGSQTPAESAGTGTADVSVAKTITGLASATSYHYRLVGVSSAGTVLGANGNFNTTAAPNVVTVGASGLTASFATLNGIVNSEGLATKWFFQYGTTTKYGSTTTVQSLAPSPSDVNVSLQVTNLLASTVYHYRLVARSSAGTSIGGDFSLTTGQPVTLNASESTVVYGTFVQLSGIVSSARSGDHVTIESQPFNQAAFTGVASIATGAGGTWSYRAQPNMRTTYKVLANGGSSSPLTVSVRPAVFLTTPATGQLATRVVGAVSFGSHVLQLQRLTNGLWVTWKPVRLNNKGNATFTTSLPKGHTPIRMAIGPFVVGVDQAAPGYLAGYSRVINYTHN